MSNPVKDGVDRAAHYAGDKLRDASTAVRETTDAARHSVSDAYAAARQRASTALETAKDKTTETRDRASRLIEDNPLAALVGGLAIGAAVGALLPRSKKETEYLGGIGDRLTGTARDAASAARDAGRNALGELGLSGDSVKDTVNTLIDNALKAANSATDAARNSLNK